MRIPINTAPVTEIELLHGIGPVLAQRIVEYREANGSFSGPDDLARVEGVSATLATALSRNIDWSSSHFEEKVSRRDWFIFGISIPIIAFLLFVEINVSVMNIRFTGPAFGGAVPSRPLTTFGDILVMLISYSPILAGISWFLSYLVGPGTIQRLLTRVAFCSAVLFGTALLGVVIWLALYFAVSPVIDWSRLLGIAASNLAAVSLSAWLLYASYPIWRYDSLSGDISPWIDRVFEIVLMISSVMNAVAAWMYRREALAFPLLISMTSGLILIYVTITAMGRNTSILRVILHTDGIGRGRDIMIGEDWRLWINRRLPDPNQQRALKRVLDAMYPTSRLRAVASVVMLTMGGWIVLTVIGAVVEWVVQNWLDEVVK